MTPRVRFLVAGVLSLMAGSLAAAEHTATPASVPVPPADVQAAVQGIVREAVRFRDGDHEVTLVLSETGHYGDGDTSHARLYATALEINGDCAWQTRWRITDHVLDCPLDLTLRFTDPAIHLSDADRDRRTEAWISYRLACRGDVSPATLKLIGHEGDQKLALRGQTTLVIGDASVQTTPAPVADAALRGAQALHAEAQAIWQRVARESFGE